MLKQLDVLIGFAVVMSIVSMLIMAISQMVLSGLQLRGKQLMDALEAMFLNLDPALAGKAKGLAEAVLRHPVISDSAKSGDSRGLASAIRPQELLDVLENLHASSGTSTQWCGNTTLKHSDQTITIADVAQAAGDVLATLQQPDPSVTQAKQQVADLIAKVPGSEAIMEPLQTLEEKARTNIQSTLQRTEKWFGTVEDRAREWFATRAQQCNVAIAVALVLVLQLDAFILYKQLESDDAYRTALVSSAAAIEKQAQDLSEKAAKPAEAAGQESPAVQFDSWKKAAGQIKKQADDLGFQLFPTKYPKTIWELIGFAKRHDSDDSAAQPGHFFSCTGLSLNPSHFLGMAFFAALLSLGAPYWFNLLKTLTSFRPLLAQQVEKEKDGTG